MACFLFPLLFLVSAVYTLTGEATFYEPGSYWLNTNDIAISGFLWLAWFAGIPAMIGVARLLREKIPHLAFWAAVSVFIGGVNQLSDGYTSMQQTLYRQLGFEIYWTTTMDVLPPIGFWGITIVLWMVGLAMLGVGVWRTAVLPKGIGGLLALGAFAFFIYQGPGGLIPALPPIAFLVAGLCFVLAFPVVGMQLWQRETAFET